MVLGLNTLVFARHPNMVERWPRDVVLRVAELYGTTDSAALQRLEAESNAADVYRVCLDANLAGYAGGWYDSEAHRLIVAANSPADAAAVRRMGAVPKLVEYSLDQLEIARKQAESELELRIPAAFRYSHLDYMQNRAVVGVAPNQFNQAQSLLAHHSLV